MKSAINPLFFIPVIIFLILLFFVPTDYHYLLKIGLLIALLPLLYMEMSKLKREDKENGTNVFKQRLIFMGIILLVLTLFFFSTRI
jgi:hypothetical protein